MMSKSVYLKEMKNEKEEKAEPRGSGASDIRALCPKDRPVKKNIYTQRQT